MQPSHFDHISPALFDSPTPQMSSKEFQRTLYTYFEEKGLVDDLRSYLRVLMIKQLKNTKVGKIEQKPQFSLSKQAFSLVIADYLLHEGCHYTLSIFSTEVPGVAPQNPFSLYEAHNSRNKWRFDEESLLNVLELIGISKTSGESLKISARYFRNGESLLSCLVAAKSANLEELAGVEGEDYLGKVLDVLGVPPKVAGEIKARVEESFVPYVRQLEVLRGELEARNEEIKRLFTCQIEAKRESKKLKTELKEAKRKLSQAVLREENLNLRERKIREKLDEVTRLQKTIIKEQNQVCDLKHCTERCQKNLNLVEELRQEIAKLLDASREKSHEIDQLKATVTSLNKDLTNSRLNIDFLNSCLLRSNQINFSEDAANHAANSSDDSSSEHITGEILNQVRSKLSLLEQESAQLDLQLKKLNLVTK
ncbi:uncharacterized protein LOC103312578 [Tribolium castaneum]|uniref:LisH domain-containing protein n=1 Tax=Tribolium castaneum TaxID=7070 RepID=D2A2F9_TRICA|nr:PREDICTED: uncharacterized protein LOC103312578 [Tribolium castaneum]EFA02033.1 hypothetical protein TcasGA2_TC007659 [Tribolium castaneum]|eukprot:XP_008191759.1 PREDICTED: uncharacterized protein LOC103312578 [Tribolium castaneum]